MYYASDSTSIQLLILPPADDGGVIVTGYKLWKDTLQTIPSYTLVYSGSSMDVTLQAATAGLSLNTLYRFRVQAVNEFGDSDFSEDLKSSLGSVPNKPHTPRKVEYKSSKTSIAVEWDQNDDQITAKVTGYKLLMDDGYNGDFSVVYDGSGFPYTFSFVAQNLTTGLPYRFKVVALNINGQSISGDSVTIFACLKPSNVLAPYKIGTTKTSITVGWYEPDNMGCPILGFELYRDTGNYDAISFLVDPSNIALRPSLRQYTVNGLAPPSHPFNFKIRAINMAGYTESVPLSVVLSAIPDTPATGPISDVTYSDNTRIKMIYGP